MKLPNYGKSLKNYVMALGAAAILTAGTISYFKLTKHCRKKTSEIRRGIEVDLNGNISNAYYRDNYFSKCFAPDKLTRETLADLDNDGLVDVYTKNKFLVTPFGPLPVREGRAYFLYSGDTDYKENKQITEKYFSDISRIKGKHYLSPKGMLIQRKFRRAARKWKDQNRIRNSL